MKIEDVTQLRKQESENNLRVPNFCCDNLQMTKELDSQRYDIVTCLKKLTKRMGKKQNYHISTLIARLTVKKNKAVKDFKGLGMKESPYKLDCAFGKGRILNAREFFEKKKYPPHIKRQYCFSNCLYYVNLLAQNGVNAKILSGICNLDSKSFLHSVVEINNRYIVDFNYDFAMNKSLYENLFHFEVLTTITGKKLLQDDLVAKLKNKFVNAMYVNFAYDDVLDYITNPSRLNENIEFINK